MRPVVTQCHKINLKSASFAEKLRTRRDETRLGLHRAEHSALKLRTAMSNPNGLQSQKPCHCLDQSRTLNDILMRAAY